MPLEANTLGLTINAVAQVYQLVNSSIDRQVLVVRVYSKEEIDLLPLFVNETVVLLLKNAIMTEKND
jgi:hypothetical protein